MILCKEVLKGFQGETFPQKVPPEHLRTSFFTYSLPRKARMPLATPAAKSSGEFAIRVAS